MRPRQKKAMLWGAGILVVALISLIGALLFGSGAMENHMPPPTNEERVSAIEESGFSDVEQAGIEAMIHDYIIDHPEVVTEALQELNRRDTQSRIDAAGKALDEPFSAAYIGNKNGAVTLVEFTDYACGYCRRSVADVEKLVRDNDDLRVVFREAPILSPQSRTAALWALAAAEQGKYAAFHRALFDEGKPTDDAILSAAKRAGLNIDTAREQIRKPEYAAELDGNIEAMRAIGVGGTPTFIIAGKIIEGAVGYESLSEELKKARQG